ncbi:alpha-glucosidase [Grimontia hollisae]|uniref:Alpha amylase n=1 Tax=Grimontia hollisae CIP 101886 TaxID=675812 RepID=D0I8Y5_GRIHO|nr:alpha-glucosidase [Grimontia hollisae]AMG28892.1 alpha-glucosidase [Grimontia hollisae]EEY71900.1 alpha amylase [Grimontia hollisae CIP 101886]STO77318.1 Oligo-1,6-glucosidase 1 [Grimontia hollisae]
MKQQQFAWWRGAVIYQIYPRSFYDANQDGIGDLPGITQQLPYVAALGVDAIWLSPFFTSPMKDFGYDVADYRDVDPLFGTLDDFKHLVKVAHDLGLKVMIDQVLSHTSDEHPWFEESRASRDNPKADWYVWADPKPDGTPPNNWLSIFGGCAWQWESRRQQYYLHNFLVSQPDLNFHNPEVVEQLLDSVTFWLDLGVDGFRLDTVNFYTHDRQLRDNPPLSSGDSKSLGVPGTNPYSMQKHRYDISQPENLIFLKKLRAVLDQYDGITTVGEIGDDNPLALMAQYTADNDKLHMAYTFDLLNVHRSPDYLASVIGKIEGAINDGWACWALSNHDVVRCITRWGAGERDQTAYGKVLLALVTSLRGSVCLYQGEELGLPEADIPFEKIQDPYGIPFWPEYKGRDGCRTPIPWHAGEEHAGFSTAEPWLPVDPRHLALAVDKQELQSDSMLAHYRTYLRWRKQHRVLIDGGLSDVTSHDQGLAFIRYNDEQRLLVAFNLSGADMTLSLPEGNWQPLEGHGFTFGLGNGSVTLPPYQAAFATI